MDFASESIGVKINEVFFEGFPLGNDVSRRIEDHTRTVENEAVIAAHLIDHRHRHLVIAGDGGQHIATQFGLANPERRRGNIQQEITAGMNQGFDRVKGVEALVPEMLVIPCVLADGQSYLLATKW